MHPSFSDKIQRPAGWDVTAKIQFNIMVSGNSLILPTSEVIEILSVQVADGCGYIVSGVIHGTEDRLYRTDGGDCGFHCRNDEALIGIDVRSFRMSYHHHRERIVVVGLP